jgi:hypothetical protein
MPYAIKVLVIDTAVELRVPRTYIPIHIMHRRLGLQVREISEQVRNVS